MNIAYFEDDGYLKLLPLTWLRACFELRIGCDRLVDKVCAHVGTPVAQHWLRPSLAEVALERTPHAPVEHKADWCLLNARAFVTDDLTPPATGTAWCRDGELLAVGVPADAVADLTHELLADNDRRAHWLADFRSTPPPPGVSLIRYPWHLVLANEAELRRQHRAGGVHDKAHVYPGAHLLRPHDICIGPEARVKPGAVLDAEDGPIYIADRVVIEPGAVLTGPCYVGPQSIIRAGAVIRGGTSIGPVCKIGGEIEGSIVHSHSNKQHDGFLGHSYVGQWVNLGADTITSDLKNTYGTIRVSINGVGVETGRRFVGATIGDHAKTGIGTILPTGAVVGLAANIFTSGSAPKFVPSFCWLTDSELTHFRLERAIDIARLVMARRDVEFNLAEQRLFEQAAALALDVEHAGWD